MFKVDSIVPVLYKDSTFVAYEGNMKSALNVDLTFSIDGVLQVGDYPLEVGKRIRENDILFKLDLRKLFKDLSAKKRDLKALAEGLKEEIGLNYPTQNKNWDTFTDNILPTKRLPQILPFISTSQNTRIQEFAKNYKGIEDLEARIEDYYVFAPFSGTVVSVKQKIGEQIHAGESVVEIAPIQACYATFNVPNKELDNVRLNDKVLLIVNKKPVRGRVSKMTRAKDDSSHSTVECSVSNTPFSNEVRVILQLESTREHLYVPHHLIRNDSLWICRQGKSMKIHAKILNWKNDSVAIQALRPGDMVLLNRQKSRSFACRP